MASRDGAAIDRVGARDLLALDRGADLGDGLGLGGLLVIERFTAPSVALKDRPIELMQAIDANRSLSQWEPFEFEGGLTTVQMLEDELQEMLVEQVLTRNLVTQVGDQYYGERAAAIAGAPGQVTCMKLGTSSTAVAKTGGGAALGTYLSGSDKAIDSTWPQSSLSGASRQIQWKTSWGAGVINGSALREVVLVIDVLADATSSAANTIARALFGPMTLGTLDTLAITWNHLLLGA